MPSIEKPVIVATNILESMTDHPTPIRVEVPDIAIAVQEGADDIMLSGDIAHGNCKVMHTVALRTESTLSQSVSTPRILSDQDAAMEDYNV